MTLRADRRPLGEWPDGRWARAIAIPVVQNGLYNRASKAVALARVLAGTTTERQGGRARRLPDKPSDFVGN